MKLQSKFDQYSNELMIQATLCPSSIDLSVVEDQLKEFVRLHHLDLIRRIQYQLNHFQGQLHEQELYQSLLLLSINDEQVDQWLFFSFPFDLFFFFFFFP